MYKMQNCFCRFDLNNCARISETRGTFPGIDVSNDPPLFINLPTFCVSEVEEQSLGPNKLSKSCQRLLKVLL